jgi:hypothetical protein
MTKDEYLITTLSQAAAQTLEQARYKAELLLAAVVELETKLGVKNGNDNN